MGRGRQRDREMRRFYSVRGERPLPFQRRPHFGIATADQLHEFLRHRPRAAIIALLRHRPAKSRPASFLPIDERGCLSLCLGLRGASDRGVAANNDVVTAAHDRHPLSNGNITRNLPQRLRASIWSARRWFGFSDTHRWLNSETRLNRRNFQLFEIVDLYLELFRHSGSDETIFHRDETIFHLSRRTAETVRSYEPTTERRELRR
jgi:hypothetical protein